MIVSLVACFLLSTVIADNFTAPLGLYTPRNWSTTGTYVELYFLDDSTVKYKIYYPQQDSHILASFPASMLSSSVVFVDVPQYQLDYWKMYHPGAFEDLGIRVFFYDAVKNRITVNGIGRSFEVLHSSDPAEDPGSVGDAKKPAGVYQALERGNITMKFDNGGAAYHFKVGEVSYSFPFDVDFVMISSSLIRVKAPRLHLHGLHGYNASRDEVTFLLESSKSIVLRRRDTSSSILSSAATTSGDSGQLSTFVDLSTARSTITSNEGDFSHHPFGDYCADRETAKMSLSFKDQYTVTFAAVYRDTHLLARGARYDVIKESGQVVISVDAVNSDLNDELRKIDWHGITRLKFVFDPVRNVVMLENHGLIAHMFIGLDCATAIETPPAKPKGRGGGSSGTVFGDMAGFIEQVVKELFR